MRFLHHLLASRNSWLAIIMIVELVVLLIGLIFYLHHKKCQKLPPGPFSLPLFGSIFSFSTGPKYNFAGALLDEKFHKYGDLYTLFIGPRLKYVIINDLELAKDLFFREEFTGEADPLL